VARPSRPAPAPAKSRRQSRPGSAWVEKETSGRSRMNGRKRGGGHWLVSFGTVGSVPAGPARQAGNVKGREGGEAEAG
jgi:hypothetical protein